MRVVGAALFAGGLLLVPLASAATFGRPAEIPLVRAPTGVVDLDATQEGAEDLVVANATGPALTILPGNVDGSFNRPIDVGTGPAPSSLAGADFDGDGNEDLAVAGGGQIAIYLAANGTLAKRITLSTASSSEVIATDLDLDGNYDIVAAGPDRAVVTVFMGTDEGLFLAPRDYDTNGVPRALFAEDVDGDGLPDIVTGGDGVSVLPGNGNGTLGPPVLVNDGRGVTALTGADLDGDGSIDLAVARTPKDVEILQNSGDGFFQIRTERQVGGTPSAIALTFADSDSELDVVTANRGTNDVSILPGAGDGQFGPEERAQVGSAPVGLAVDDLNADSSNDLVTANRKSKSVTVLLNGADAPQPVVCLVPKVARRTLAQARRLVAAAHCTTASVRRRYSGRVKKGKVISVTPAPGTRRPVGTAVTVLVSKGPRPKR